MVPYSTIVPRSRQERGPWLAPLALLAAILLVCDCTQESAVWLDSGSTSDHLTFLIGRHRRDVQGTPISSLDVTACSDPDETFANKYWGVIRAGNDISVHRIQYGAVPRGFGQHHTPLRLTPGCYRVRISGSGRTRFTVRADVTVVEQR